MTWLDVMTKLTGARLAALDELQKQGERSAMRVAMDCDRHGVPEIVDAVVWLCAHHLAWETAPGLFRARSVDDARGHFERSGGPLKILLQEVRETSPATVMRGATAAAAPAPDIAQERAAPTRPRVHDYQSQLFADL
jgi:hypothetical protein